MGGASIGLVGKISSSCILWNMLYWCGVVWICLRLCNIWHDSQEVQEINGYTIGTDNGKPTRKVQEMTYDITNTNVIYLGRQGENLARTVEIDVSSILGKWPTATISLLVQRNQEDTFYLAPVVIENGILKWTISNADTEFAGDGKAEIRATQDDVIVKSAIMNTHVSDSLGGTETDIPDPAQTWADTIVAASEQAKQSAEEALASELAAKEAADSILGISENSVTYTEQTLTTDQQMQARKNQGLYYETKENIFLLQDESLTATEHHSVFSLNFDTTIGLVFGASHTVIYDGVQYECTCFEFNKLLCIGNLGIPGMGTDTGEPFLFVENTKHGSYATKDGETHVVSICATKTHVEKIDQKYLSNFPVLIDKYPDEWEEGAGQKYWEAYIAGRPVIFTAGINLSNRPGCGIVLSASENFEKFMYLEKSGRVVYWDGSTSSLTSEIRLTKSGIEDEIQTYYYDYIHDKIVNCSAKSMLGITTSGDGAAYTATVDGLSVIAGASFIMIPHTTSTSQAPTLNVNDTGAKNIRRRISSSTAETTVGYNASWLAANKPVRVTYDGTFWIADIPCQNAEDIYGTLSEEAITRLGISTYVAEQIAAVADYNSVEV